MKSSFSISFFSCALAVIKSRNLLASDISVDVKNGSRSIVISFVPSAFLTIIASPMPVCSNENPYAENFLASSSITSPSSLPIKLDFISCTLFKNSSSRFALLFLSSNNFSSSLFFSFITSS